MRTAVVLEMSTHLTIRGINCLNFSSLPAEFLSITPGSTDDFREASRMDRVAKKLAGNLAVNTAVILETGHCFRPSLAMATVDQILTRGPPGSDIVGGLEQLREAVLSNGIPSNSDGMVLVFTTTLHKSIRLTMAVVRATYIYMAHLAEHSSSSNRRLPGPRPTRCFASIHKDSQ